jgi:hypothetical protein
VSGVQVGIEAERAVKHFMESSALLGEVAVALATRGDSNAAVMTLGQSLSELRKAEDYIQRAHEALTQLAHFIEANRNADYELHLQRCGFRGSYFLLAEYKQHLDRMRQALSGAASRWPVAEEAVRAGVLDDFLKDFSPGANAAMRIVCREVIDMLEFQHRVAETRYALLSFMPGPISAAGSSTQPPPSSSP